MLLTKTATNPTSFYPSVTADSVLDLLFNTKKDIGSSQIPIEIFERKESWLINAFIPGVNKKDIYINVKSGNVIHITSVRQKPEEKVYLTELEYGEMEANIKLGSLSFIKKEDIEAKYLDGILSLTILKHPDSLPYNVEIE